jgi:hypothetical protein
MRFDTDLVASIGAMTIFHGAAFFPCNGNLCVVANFDFLLQAGQ